MLNEDLYGYVWFASRVASLAGMAQTDLTLPTPTHFPAFPYDPPYPIQLDIMRHLYAAIEQGKVTIVESPTGTGKTLSLLCASMTWLADDKNRAKKGKLREMAGEGDSGA